MHCICWLDQSMSKLNQHKPFLLRSGLYMVFLLPPHMCWGFFNYHVLFTCQSSSTFLHVNAHLISSQSLGLHSHPFSSFFSFSPLQLHSDFLSNNPSIFVLEWRANAFHLCVSVVGLQGQGLPLFAYSPRPPLPSPLQLLSDKTLSGSTQPWSLRSHSTLGPLLAWGSRGRLVGPLDPADSGSLWNDSFLSKPT